MAAIQGRRAAHMWMGFWDAVEKPAALDAGSTDYMTKPWDRGVLGKDARAWLAPEPPECK